MSHDLRPGSELVKGYTLIERLGKGGFGEVWKATGPGGFEVALKFVALEGNVGTVELRALEIIKGIRHPHLLPNFGSWQVDNVLIIAMELADRTLLDRLREAVEQGLPGIPAPEIFEYFVEAAKGLDFLNEPRHPGGEGGLQGIQHRDIKPQNLLLLGGSVKVADFGLARVLESSKSGGHSGSMTPYYAPPEAFREKTSHQSDQYSLAITYCQLRGGRVPFEGRVEAVMWGHLHGEPDLSMLPESERPAVTRALSKVPTDRWPSCRAFIRALTATEGVVVPDTVFPSDFSRKEPTQPKTDSGGMPITPVPLTDTESVIDLDYPIWAGPAQPDTASGGPAIKPDRISELAHAEPRPQKRLVYKIAGWALVAAVLLIAAVLLFPRGKPEVAVASQTPAHGSPDTKSQGLADQPGLEATKIPPAITTKRPSDEVTKPAVPLVPDLAKPEKDTLAIRSLIDRGLALKRGPENLEARALLEEAIRLDPGNAEAHAGLAFAWGRGPSQDHSRGLAEAEKAIQLNPKLALAHAARSSYHLRKDPQNLAGALTDANEAIRLDPNLALAYELRAQVNLDLYDKVSHKAGDIRKVIADSDAAIRLDPSRTWSYLARGDAWNAVGNLDQAIADYSSFISDHPNHMWVFMHRAWALQKKKEYARAIEDCDRAIELDPNFSVCYRTRSDCHRDLGHMGRANADRAKAEALEREGK